MHKKLKPLLILFPIIAVSCLLGSCDKIAQLGVSKNCDELAEKFLKSSFEKASENNGQFYTTVVTTSNFELLDQQPYNQPMNAIQTLWRINGTVYSIDNSGNITKSPITGYRDVGPSSIPSVYDSERTQKLVSSPDQIACRYNTAEFTLNPTSLKLGGWSSRGSMSGSKWGEDNQHQSYGQGVTVTEDKENIRWE